METIKLKKSGWILVVLVIVIIICIAIWKDHSFGMERESKFSRLSKRLQELSDQLKVRLESLKLTDEMKVFVDKRVNTILRGCHIFFILIGLSISITFYLNGQDPITAVLSTTGVLALCFALGSLLIANKFTEPNSFIEWVRKNICKWVYKKYGYDPERHEQLIQSVELMENEHREIRTEIDKMQMNDAEDGNVFESETIEVIKDDYKSGNT